MLDGSMLPVSLKTSAAVAGAFIIGAYVLFGSPTDVTQRRRKKKDFIPGLANIGNSCFLNALVQALASCPMFISWLSNKYSSTGPPLVSALHNLLRVLNNEDDGEGDACARQVLSALRGHGWVISSEEQDTHELFHVVTSTIEDELTTASSVPSLLDVAWLDLSHLGSVQDGVALKADSWKQSSCGHEAVDKQIELKENVLENALEDVTLSKENSLDENVIKDATFKSLVSNRADTFFKPKEDKGNKAMIEDSRQNINNITNTEEPANHSGMDGVPHLSCCKSTGEGKNDNNSTEENPKRSHPNPCDTGNSFKESASMMQAPENCDVENDKCLENKEDSCVKRKPAGILVVGSGIQRSTNYGWRTREDQHDIPFRGYLASQLQCAFCGHKNPAQWTSFESLSLSLPAVPYGDISLTELLDSYVKPEKVTDVSCDACSRRARTLVKTSFTKQLTIGKLPDCMCFHIKRTVWLENGSAVKRRDHLTFPEFLVMDPYTYTTSITSQGNNKSRGGSQPCSSDPGIIDATESSYQHSLSSVISQSAAASFQEPSSLVNVSRLRYEQLYHLRSVIVHVGDVFCGHFVTYRRGPIGSRAKNRWFYTSDLLVRESDLEEVQKANGYMIIYEKVM